MIRSSLWSPQKLLLAIALAPLTGLCFESPYVAESNVGTLQSLATADVQRGRLLYETYCVACHTTQAHWRDKHIVKSWADLLYQVTRMQKNAGQDWNSAEISDVATYLNETFYSMPCPPRDCGGPEARAGDRTRLACRSIYQPRSSLFSGSSLASQRVPR